MFAAPWCAVADPTPTGHKDNLTARQRAFITEYISGEARFNASGSALAAGFKERTYGPKLLQNATVRARINEELAAHAASAAEVLAELRDVAFRRLDEEIEVRRFGEELTARMDAHAKMKALELLAKANGLLTENHNISGSLTREFVIRHISTNTPLDDDKAAG